MAKIDIKKLILDLAKKDKELVSQKLRQKLVFRAHISTVFYHNAKKKEKLCRLDKQIKHAM